MLYELCTIGTRWKHEIDVVLQCDTLLIKVDAQELCECRATGIAVS